MHAVWHTQGVSRCTPGVPRRPALRQPGPVYLRAVWQCLQLPLPLPPQTRTYTRKYTHDTCTHAACGGSGHRGRRYYVKNVMYSSRPRAEMDGRATFTDATHRLQGVIHFGATPSLRRTDAVWGGIYRVDAPAADLRAVRGAHAHATRGGCEQHMCGGWRLARPAMTCGLHACCVCAHICTRLCVSVCVCVYVRACVQACVCVIEAACPHPDTSDPCKQQGS